MKAAYIHPNPPAADRALMEHSGMGVVIFPTLEQTLAQDEEFNAFIFSNQLSAQILIDSVQVLRQRDHDFLCPVFLDKPLNRDLAYLMELFDGDLIEADGFKTRMQTIQMLQQQLTLNQKDWKSKVLYYLFTRPNKPLIPGKNYHWQEYYRYPVIEVFLPAHRNYLAWLEDLIDLGVFERGQLVDGFFYCPHCRSAHLQFTELCPNCKGFHLKPAKFVHCFTCGAIAPQEEFLTNNRLVCPKCRAVLRHITEDYDYSLESGVCLDCNEYYMESDMKACCMICDKKYQTDQIKKIYVYQLSLTDQGRDYVRFNSVETSLNIFDKINYVSPAYFYSVIDWLIQLHKRYPKEYFSILGLKLNVLAIQNEKADAVYEIAQAVRKVVRTTDLLTRLSENFIWILLPKTNVKGAERVIERMTQLMPEEEGLLSNISFVKYTVADKSEIVEDSNVLIATLMEELK